MFTMRMMCLVAGGFMFCGALAAQGQENVQPVVVTGEGISRDAARKDALRKALEQGGRIEIASHSQAENFVLIRDSIYARAEGIVTDYQILEEKEGVGGTFLCTIRARVDPTVIASTWGAVQNVLDQIGRPGVAVMIKETIDGVVQDSSILESKIEERLVKAGFDVYDSTQLREIARKEGDDAALEDNINKLQALAKNFNTQIFITGTANANAAGLRDLYGEPTAMYNCDAVAKMFYTDTARLLASESIPNWRGGARGFSAISPQAGKKALENAGADLVEKIYQTVMAQWATQISAGGEVRIEVEGVNMGEAIRLKKMFEAIPGVEKINGPSLDKGIATYRIVAKMTAEQLVEHLVQGDFEKILDVIDLKLNRIQAKKK